MKKVIALFLVVFGFVSFGSVRLEVQAADYVLRVYNWQDYIDEGKDETAIPGSTVATGFQRHRRL